MSEFECRRLTRLYIGGRMKSSRGIDSMAKAKKMKWWNVDRAENSSV